MSINIHDQAIYHSMCLPLRDSPEEAIVPSLFSRPSFSWETFIQRGSQQLLLPLMYHNFKKAGLLDLIPTEVLEFLQYTHEKTTERNRLILEQVEEIIQALHRNGINILFLKGAANFLDNLYDHPAERVMSDIDFYIEEKDYRTSLSLLDNLGYQPLGPKKNINYGKGKHHDILIREGSPAGLELHFTPVGEKLRPYLPFAGKIENEKKLRDYPNAYCFDDEKKILLNFLQLSFVKLSSRLFQAQLGRNPNFYRKVYDHLLLKERTSRIPELHGDMGRKLLSFDEMSGCIRTKEPSKGYKEGLLNVLNSQFLYVLGNCIINGRRELFTWKKKLRAFL